MTRFSSHEGSVADLASAFGSDLVSGLSAPVAADRLREYGPNELATEVVVTAWRRFLAQFHDALVILLLVVLLYLLLIQAPAPLCLLSNFSILVALILAEILLHLHCPMGQQSGQMSIWFHLRQIVTVHRLSE